MNDDFLHNHRKTPPPDFASKLRQRLHEEDTHMTTQAAVGTRNGASEAQNHHRTNGRPASQDGFQVPLTHTSHTAARERGRSTVLTLALALAAMLALISLVIIGRTPPAGDPAQASLPPLLPITAENATRVREITSIGKGNLYQVAYSPDGSLLALAGTRGVWLHTTADLTAPARLLEGADMDFIKRVLAWSPDGSLLAMSNGNGTRVWNPVTGAVVADVDYPGQVMALSFNPDAPELAIGGGNLTVEDGVDYQFPVRIWNSATGETDDRLMVPGTSINAIRYSPARLYTDGGRLAVTTVGLLMMESGRRPPSWSLLVFRTADNALSWNLDDRSAGGTALIFSKDGQIIYSDQSSRIIGWDVESGEQVIESPTLTSPTYDESLAINPAGTEIAIASINTGLRLWSLAEDTLNVRAVETQGRLNYTTSVAYSPDGSQLATIEYAGLVQIWDAQTGEEVAAIRDYAGNISALRLMPDQQQIFVADQTGTLRFYDLNTGEELRRFQGSTPLFNHMADLSPDGNVVAIPRLDINPLNEDARTLEIAGISLLDALTGSEVAQLELDDFVWGYLLFSPDGHWLVAVGMNNGIRVWDMTQTDSKTGKPLVYFTVDVEPVIPQFNIDGRYLAFVSTGINPIAPLRIYNLLKPEQPLYQARVLAPSDTIIDLAWSPDNRTLALISNTDSEQDNHSDAVSHGVHLFDLESQQVSRTATAENYPYDVAYSPDGSILAVMVNGRVALYDAATLDVLAELPQSAAYLVNFSSDGSMLLTGGWDGIVRVWGVTE